MKQDSRFKIQEKGFTIIETLVAITILMIAVAGPLVAANRGLVAATYSRNQLTASFLAQETMEVLKNYRSNTVALSGPGFWTQSDFNNCFDVGNKCDVGAMDFFGLQLGCDPGGGCMLSLGPDGYDHSGGTLSPQKFYRYFYLENISASEVRAHVVVEWTQGTIPYQIELVSEIVDANR